MWIYRLALGGLYLSLSVTASKTTGVLSIPPSLYWDGADGSWSTFEIQVGTPGQTVRLLPGTSANAGNSIWVVIPEGCSAALNANVSNCANDRGYLFSSNVSTTWSTQRLSNGGLYQLDTFEEGELGLTGNAYYGFDTVQLGIQGSNLPTLDNQLIAGYVTNSFWLGSLGLSPIPFNFTNLDDPLPSMLSTLRNQSYITGLSWAYTAGASYKNPPVFGSLTLGGYDAARYNASTALGGLPFGADFSRDLLIGVQSITYNGLGSSPLLSTGIYAFIDSMVSTMYLPIEVCQAFEQAFNLTWNSTTELYILSAEQHTALVAQNPTFTFTLSPQASGSGPTIDITLPYAAFDLKISQPYVSEASYYFPLQRAQNQSQYTLGRVFLQEAYVVADYDRHQFQIAQAQAPYASSGAGQQLKVIHPPNATGSSSLSVGALVGIVIGVVVALTLVLAGLILYIRHRKRRSGAPTKQGLAPEQTDVVDEKRDPVPELAPNRSEPFVEADEGTAIHEIGSHKGPASELAVKEQHWAHELPAADSVQEKDGNETRPAPVELEAPWK